MSTQMGVRWAKSRDIQAKIVALALRGHSRFSFLKEVSFPVLTVNGTDEHEMIFFTDEIFEPLGVLVSIESYFFKNYHFKPEFVVVREGEVISFSQFYKEVSERISKMPCSRHLDGF